MRLFLLLICVGLIKSDHEDIIEEFQRQIMLSSSTAPSNFLPYLCQTLSSPEFIKSSEDDDLLSSILYELGFGALGIKENSWATRYRSEVSKYSLACYAALHSVAMSGSTKMPLADSRKILRRCCLSNSDL